MAGLILTLILCFVLAGITWLVAGSRLSLRVEQAENDLANLAAYGLFWLPISLVIVFFGIAGS